MPGFFIKNLGCAKNQFDGEVLESFLIAAGMEPAEDVRKADLIILNTCGFIEDAKRESIDAFFELCALKGKGAKIVFAGCMAERYYSDLLKSLPEADAILGNYDISQISSMLENGFDCGRKLYGVNEAVSDNYNKKQKVFAMRDENFRREGNSYFVKLAEGCNHRCSYCAIPLIRGSLVSAPMDDIVRECIKLQRNGAREINLVAQDLMSYGSDRSGQSELIGLLGRLADTEGDARFRILYIHPDMFDMRLCEFVSEHAVRFFPYFDIPIQHADSRILSSMGRKGDSRSYLNLIRSIRSVLPDAVIRSTFMVGYPGEDGKSLAVLQDFIESAELEYSGFFLYSREEGTKAYDLPFDGRKRRSFRKRLDELNAIQTSITENRLGRFAGRAFDALIEDVASFAPDDKNFVCRIFAQAPEVDGITVVPFDEMHHIGDLVRVKIDSVSGCDLNGIRF